MIAARIWKPIRGAFSLEGMTPEIAAVSIALAVVLGVFPMYGCPTLLCAAAAVALRLNLPVMQAVNLCTSPLQFLLWLPFGRLGQHLLHLPPSASLAARVGTAALHSVAGWCCVAAPLALLVYVALAPAMRMVARMRVEPA